MDEKPSVVEPHPERVDDNWLVLDYPNNPRIRLDARLLDRALVTDDYLILEVGDVRIVLQISSGALAAHDIAEQLMPHTRSAPLVDEMAYRMAKGRLTAAQHGGRRGATPSLFYGEDAVYASDDVLYVGSFKCFTSDVEWYALEGHSLPLPNGAMQASLAQLVIADRHRKEDLAVLRQRVADYEARMEASPSISAGADKLDARERALRAEFDHAMSLREHGELQRALESLESLVAKLTAQDKKPLTHSYLQLGNILGKIGQDDRAVATFQRAVELSPTHELSSLALFHKLIKVSQWRLAVREMIRYLEIRDCQDYRDMLVSGFRNDVPPELSALADQARELLRRYDST